MKAIMLIIALMLVGCASSKIPIKVRVPDSVVKSGRLSAVDSCKFGCSIYDVNLRDVGSIGFMALKSSWTEYAKEACESRCEVIPYTALKRGIEVQEINP